MQCEVSEDPRMATLLASFGEKNKSPYDHVIASIQSGIGASSWETAIARLLQEFDEQEWAQETTTSKVKKIVPMAFNAYHSDPSPNR